MPRILIDITRLLYRRLTHTLPTGIDRVSIEYIRHYGPQARAVLALGPFSALMSEHDSACAFAALTQSGFGGRLLMAKLVAKAVLWRWLWAPRRLCFLLNTSHIGLENRRYAWTLRHGGALLVVMVHDLIPITHPEYVPAGADAAHHTRMRSMVTLASGVIANSQYTLDSFEAYCQERAMPVPPAAVARLAPGLTAMRAEARGTDKPLDGPYFVILGTIEPRKNHWMLLQVWRDMVERLGSAAPRLVIVGQRGWECENVVDLLDRCRVLQGVIIERGRCSDAELLTYLQHATALLFPSFVEGYGMPVAEALALGVPVIASDIPVFHEIAGAVPDYVSPLDGRRWEELVLAYSEPVSTARNAQLCRLRTYQPTHWKGHFQIVDALLDRLQATADSRT